MKVIVGLGNPGREYEQTRHNVGFIAVDQFLERNGVNLNDYKDKFGAHIYELRLGSEKVLVVKPQKYMNLSGHVLAEIVNFYKVDVCEDVLVVFDDKDIEFGKIKTKFESSHGGHNGVRNIIDCLGTKKINRIKIGINSIRNKETKDFVLGRFSKDEQVELNEILVDVLNKIEDFIK